MVQKRINTRIFALGGKNPDNPAPGTVLDHTVTKRDWFDFFLVSQHVGQVRNESTNEILKTYYSLTTYLDKYSGHGVPYPLHRGPRQHRVEA